MTKDNTARHFKLSPSLSRGERGALLAPPGMAIRNASGSVHLDHLVPVSQSLINTALLFHDKIDIPENNTISVAADEIAFLRELGIADRSNIDFERGVAVDEAVNSYSWLAYTELNRREPGLWSIWQEPNNNIIPSSELSPDLAFQLELSSGLIIPHHDLPYDDVLSFKDRHRDELIALRHYLEEFAIKLSKEGDPRAVNLERERFDASLAGYLRKARHSNLRKSVASLTTEFDWSAAARAAVGGGGIALAIQGLSLVTAAAAVGNGFLAGLSIKSVAGSKEGASPFRYIARVEKEYG